MFVGRSKNNVCNDFSGMAIVNIYLLQQININGNFAVAACFLG